MTLCGRITNAYGRTLVSFWQLRMVPCPTGCPRRRHTSSGRSLQQRQGHAADVHHRLPGDLDRPQD